MPQNDDAYKLFTLLAEDLGGGTTEVADQILCPLCLQAFARDAVGSGALSIEHIVPSSLGGTVKTLTCKRCNNAHGSAFETHLVKMLETLDALEGRGTLRAVLHNERGRVSANVAWRSGTRDDPRIVRVVQKASHPAGVSRLRDLLQNGADLHITLDLGFIPDRYWRAVLRCGYLLLFECFGYAYALSKGATEVRRVLSSGSPPPQVVLEAHPSIDLPVNGFAIPLQAPGISPFFMVILQFRTTVPRYLAVMMPGADGYDWDVLVRLAAKPMALIMRARCDGAGEELVVRFSHEPFDALRRTSFTRNCRG